ncbi:Hypothetical protein MAU_1680 [Metamycoplasma auris 15026]|uniref:Uncharacterized protein n=1 Tax=Metamycoplasma auris 15026 TaxID=1188233 RepID=N9V156_9BACT|nr:hypothetical protein [Metamycoplasma auris]ENY69127.1 Hypothetical protein MAU_1680 [Metamycoplasma auris 15026]
MKKLFKKKHIKWLQAYEDSKNINVYRMFNNKARSFKVAKEQEIYVELIKNIVSSLEDFDEDFIQLIYDELKVSKNLNWISKIAKMTEELRLTSDIKKCTLFDLFIKNNSIFTIQEIWTSVDTELKEKGILGNVLLASDLVTFNHELKDKDTLVQINSLGRLELISSLRHDLMDWIAGSKIQDLILCYSYSKDDFVNDNQEIFAIKKVFKDNY